MLPTTQRTSAKSNSTKPTKSTPNNQALAFSELMEDKNNRARQQELDRLRRLDNRHRLQSQPTRPLSNNTAPDNESKAQAPNLNPNSQGSASDNLIVNTGLQSLTSPSSSFESVHGSALESASSQQLQLDRQHSAPNLNTGMSANPNSEAAELAAVRGRLSENDQALDQLNQGQQSQQRAITQLSHAQHQMSQQIDQAQQAQAQAQQQMMQQLQQITIQLQQQRQQSQSQQQQQNDSAQDANQNSSNQNNRQQQVNSAPAGNARGVGGGGDPSNPDDDDGSSTGSEDSEDRRRRRARRDRRSILPRAARGRDDGPLLPPAAAGGPQQRNDWIIKPHPPTTFSGQRSQCKAFVHSINCALKMNPAMTGLQQVIFASSFLQQHARAWLEAAEQRDPQNQYELSDWAHMRKALLQFFSSEQDGMIVRANLRAMRQNKSAREFVVLFNSELLKLDTGLHPDTAMDYFREGLRENVALALATHKYHTLEELQEAAVRTDEALAVHVRRARVMQHSQSNRQSSKVNQLTIDLDQDDDQFNSVESSSKDKSTIDDRLMKLQQKSTKSNKTQPKRQSQRLWSDQQTSRYEKNECFRCGSTEHRIRDCPNRPNHTSKNEESTKD